jgi:hypothetical protein
MLDKQIKTRRKKRLILRMPRKRRKPREGESGTEYAPQIAVRVDWDVIERLDRIAAASGIRKNRSDLVREAIDRLLEEYESRNNR